MQQLGLLESGGAVRVGFVHTTTVDEVDRLLEALEGDVRPDD
jgi:selenocysteine lyase/cysteine desulfurase